MRIYVPARTSSTSVRILPLKRAPGNVFDEHAAQWIYFQNITRGFCGVFVGFLDSAGKAVSKAGRTDQNSLDLFALSLKHGPILAVESACAPLSLMGM